jgi:methionyl-tRNA formyltransferase
MRLVFAGTPEAALPSLRALLDSTHQVVAVVTRPDAPRGRGRRLTPSPVATLASSAGLQLLKPSTPKEPEFLARLRRLAPDCCPVVAYGALVPDAALPLPLHGWVNLHFSLLPAWRGAAPVQRALIAGDEVTGATTFRLVHELDAGPTYGCCTETVRADDTAGSLLQRLAAHGADLLLRTLDGLESGTLEARPQPASGVSLAPKLTVGEAEVDWSRPAFAIDRLVRGCTPAPGSWTSIAGAGDRLKLGPVRVCAGAESLAPGALRVGKHQVLAGTGTDPVELSTVQPAGKPHMLAVDWARGLREPPPAFGR